MDKKSFGYAVSGTPLFCMVIGALGHENMIESVKRYAEIERELFDIPAEEENKDVHSTYFIPRTDDQSDAINRLIAEFVEEYGDNDKQKEFFADVLVTMYYRQYDLLIGEMDKILEARLEEEADDEETD